MDAIFTLQQKRLLRVDEAARILNISRWTVYRWVEDGRLGGTRLGAGSLRIFSETVATLIDHHCVGVPVEAVVPRGTQVASQADRPSRSNRGRARSRQEACDKWHSPSLSLHSRAPPVSTSDNSGGMRSPLFSFIALS